MMQDEIQVITRSTEDGVTDEIFFENFGEGTSTTVPSALTRWAEEGQILDAQGVHYCVAAVKPEILPVLLKHQAEEITKGREEEQKKKAEAQAKAAAAKKGEEERKKQESSKDGGETSTAGEGQSTSTEASAAASDAGVAQEGQSEGMQVEQQPVAAESEPSVSEQGASDDTSVLVSMSMDEPALETSTSLSDQAAVRTSTPANDNEDHSSAALAMTPPTTAPVSLVVQDIISAATVEAANLSVGDEEPAPPSVDVNTQGSASEAERTEQEARQQESNGSPMTLGEEGAPAATDTEAAQNPSDAGLVGTYMILFIIYLFLCRYI